jgi:hypothetical protein
MRNILSPAPQCLICGQYLTLAELAGCISQLPEELPWVDETSLCLIA